MSDELRYALYVAGVALLAAAIYSIGESIVTRIPKFRPFTLGSGWRVLLMALAIFSASFLAFVGILALVVQNS